MIMSAIVVVILAASGFAQIKGCTSDIRTGVCNKVCNVTHVEGCTLDQLTPLLQVQHMDCVTAATNQTFAEIDKGKHNEATSKARLVACEKQFDDSVKKWQDAQKAKTNKPGTGKSDHR